MSEPTQGQEMSPASQNSSIQDQPNPTVAHSKRTIWYILCVCILIILGFGGWLLFANNAKQQADTGTIEYTTGLAKDQVSVQMVNDEDIERYPVAAITVATLNVYMNTFEGLTIYRGTNKLEPGLAESWTNPNPKTWRIKLRKGVTFQSGDPFTARDVKFTIEQAKASEKNEQPWFVQSWAARVDSVTVIDDYTVDLKTIEPDASLINYLVYVGMLSEAQVKRDGLANAVGTGPYSIVSIEKRRAVLEANPTYWGGAPRVKRVVYNVIPDPQTAKEALTNGNLDISFVSTPQSKAPAPKGFYSANYSTAGIVYILFDVSSTKSKKYVSTPLNPFKDARVRKAIALAVDMPKLIAEAQINARPVTQFATPELIGYNPQLKSQSQNIQQAKKLLAEAGFADGFTVVFDVDNHADHMKIAEGMKKQLAEIGIKLTLNTPETEELYNRLEAGDFSMMYQFYYPDTLDSIDLVDTLFHTQSGSHGSYNVSNYSNKELDSIINQAASTFDAQKRIDLTHQAHTLVMNDIPSLPLYTENYQIIARDDVSYNASINMLVQGIELSGRQKSR